MLIERTSEVVLKLNSLIVDELVDLVAVDVIVVDDVVIVLLALT